MEARLGWRARRLRVPLFVRLDFVKREGNMLKRLYRAVQAAGMLLFGAFVLLVWWARQGA